MSSLPLHPAIVHIPLGLAFILPALTLVFAWALWRGRIGFAGWFVIVALQLMLLGAGWLAMNTGEHEEDRVEKIVGEAVLKTHESYAEQFLWATGVTFVFAALVPAFRRPRIARALTVASVAGTLVVAALAVRVGHAGGQLVYAHNAASAYVSGSRPADPATGVPPAPSRERSRHGDDDER